MVTRDVASELAVRRVGRGRPLVLAYGLGCDQTVWAPLVEEWAREFEVFTFDYAGCGRATRVRDPARYGTLRGYAGDLIDVLGEVGAPAMVVGHSVGASIAMLASIERRDLFDRLVMVAPSPRFRDDPASGYVGGFNDTDIAEVLALIDRNFVGWASSFARTVAPTDRGAAQMEASFLATDRASFQSFAALAFNCDVRPELPRVSVPTLLVQSSNDPIAPTVVGEYLHGAIAGSRLKVIDVPGHCPHITAPRALEAELRAFLEPP